MPSAVAIDTATIVPVLSAMLGGVEVAAHPLFTKVEYMPREGEVMFDYHGHLCSVVVGEGEDTAFLSHIAAVMGREVISRCEAVKIDGERRVTLTYEGIEHLLGVEVML